MENKEIIIDEDTWIISDTHFGHLNIIKYSNRPHDHDEIMIKNWYKNVGMNDTILHLGDVMFGDRQYWSEKIARLPGKKFLIRGNHDHTKDIKLLQPEFTLIPDFIQEFKGKRVYFSHYPDQPKEDIWDINIHGHIHNNDYDPFFFPGLSNKKIYFNASVEVMDYRPWRLSEILRRLSLQS